MIRIEFEAPIGMDTVREWSVSRDGQYIISGATSADAEEIIESYVPGAAPDEAVEIVHAPACRHETIQISRTTIREIMAD